MSDVPTVCPKCQGEMAQGFIADFGHSAADVESWASGNPKKGWFSGIHAPILGRIPIATFRCEACGYLESYARKEFAPK